MTTKSETILAAIATLAAGTFGVSGRVYRSRTEALRREETPAIIIEPVQSAATYSVIDFVDWELQLKATVFTRGAVPETQADAIVQDLYARLMADRSLSGLVHDVAPAGISYQNIDGDKPVGITDLVFNVRFRTLADDLTQ